MVWTSHEVMYLPYIVVLCMQPGPQTQGVVYPGAVDSSVVLDPGACCTVTAGGTSCTAIITEDGVYTVSLTLTNDVGSTEPVVHMFDCKHIVCTYSVIIKMLVHNHSYSESIKGGGSGFYQRQCDTEFFLS